MTPNLFTLPLELRQNIYELLLWGEIVSHGFGKATSNRTAILRTCRQIHREAHEFVASNVSFHFRSTGSLLDTLIALDHSIISKIRRIRVKAFPFPLYTSGDMKYYTTYCFQNALSLFPGLCLDRLVVEDCFHEPGVNDGFGDLGTYFELDSLLWSDGWKELHFVSPTTRFVTWPTDRQDTRRSVQPDAWNASLREKDGEDSGAKVEMYLAKGTSKGATDSFESCHKWRLDPSLEGGVPLFEETYKEVRVVAQRGRYVDYTQPDLTDNGDIQRLLKCHSWKEVKEKGFHVSSWTPYYYDAQDTSGLFWLYGGWGRRLQLALRAMQ